MAVEAVVLQKGEDLLLEARKIGGGLGDDSEAAALIVPNITRTEWPENVVERATWARPRACSSMPATMNPFRPS